MKTHRFDPWSALFGLILIGFGGLAFADRLDVVRVTAETIDRWTLPVALVLVGLLIMGSLTSKARHRAR